ncbi:MAG: carbon-nitrogen hydrolase family protein [Armatimonadota bacterium]|nr:carbon-nitrogen hydrolase family protein [Armatimonadota bacterium]
MSHHAALASVSKHPQYGIGTPEDTARLMDDTAKIIRRASHMGADILAFPEVYPQLATSGRIAFAEPEDGGTLLQIRELAAKHNLYIVWPRFEQYKDGLVYNSAVVVGRDGRVVGRYHKMFPTVDEMDAGVMPGRECPVLDTDIGRIAVVICFDLNFMEVRAELRETRPDLVIFCSMYRGGIQCHEWAVDLGVPLLSAISGDGGRVVDAGGKLLRLSSDEALIVQRVNLNSRQIHMDYNWEKLDAMVEHFGSQLTIEDYTQERVCVVGYEGSDRSIDDILREYGLELKSDYFARSRWARKRKLMSLEPQTYVLE